MRRAAPALLALLAAATGCQDEPSFDERYDAAQERIRDTAQGIDNDLAKSSAGEAPAAEESPAAPAD